MTNFFEKYLISVIRGEKRGFFAGIVRGILRFLSWPYRAIVGIRNWAYDNEWLKQYQSPIPVVVSIGNIVAGGTGKTPVTLMIANEFYEETSLAILSRGYRSYVEKLQEPVLLSGGNGPQHSAAYCGDEPYLLAENLPKALIYVGKNRIKSANLAAKSGVELALLEDGMQHRKLGRDYEIVVIDVDDPLGQNYHLPRGFLRENPTAFSRADLIILNHCNEKESFERSKKTIEAFTEAPIVGTQMIFQKGYDLQGNEAPPLTNKKVALFCGIGKPDQFIKMVESSGAEVIGKEIFPDHAQYSPEEINQLVEKYHLKGAEFLVCTEKDRVKLSAIDELPIPIIWMKVELQVVENQEGWEKFVDTVRKTLLNRTQKAIS